MIFSFHTSYKSSVRLLGACALGLMLLASCRGDDIVIGGDGEDVAPPAATVPSVEGFYLLNEGNMGMNACTLDYYDYTTGKYISNIYGTANPSVPKELGDVGNDIAIYGSRLYAVINCSNKVEVMDAATARRIGQIDIPNCRYIVFRGAYAYVTSYAGPVVIDPDYKQLGYVAKVDTATLEVVNRCTVGFQPDGLAISGDMMYVANSGGYMVPNYENTLSAIDLRTFAVTASIPIAINLQYVLADRRGALWVSSRGDYYGTPSRLFRYDPSSGRVTDSLAVAAGSLWLHGDSLYVAGASFNYDTGDEAPCFKIIDTRTAAIVNDCFVAAGPEGFVKPYGVAVNPANGDIILTDAGNYVNPGYVYCLDREGVVRWKVRGGDIPAHCAFQGMKKVK